MKVWGSHLVFCLMVRLMVQKSGVHQLRLVVYPIVYRVFASQVMQDFFHQQYFSRICIDRFAGVADVYNYRFHLLPHPGCWLVTTRIIIYIFSSGSQTKPSLGVGVDPKYRVHMGVSVPLPFHPPQFFAR